MNNIVNIRNYLFCANKRGIQMGYKWYTNGIQVYSITFNLVFIKKLKTYDCLWFLNLNT